jgi:hypothetical protein
MANLPGLLEDGSAAETPELYRIFGERPIEYFRDLFAWR